MASNDAQKTKPPSAIPIIAPLETLVCAGGGEVVGVCVAVVVKMLALFVTDEVVAVVDVVLDRKSAAFAGSFDKKAGAKSVCEH